MDEQHRKARSALTRMIFMSGMTNRFEHYLWFAWSGRLPAAMRRKVKPEQIGLVDHEGGGWRAEAVQLTAETIQQGGEKVFRKYEKAKNSAVVRLRIENSNLQKMRWHHRLSGKAQRQQRRVAKARVWVNARAPAERKAEIIWGWCENGRVELSLRVAGALGSKLCRKLVLVAVARAGFWPLFFWTAISQLCRKFIEPAMLALWTDGQS